VRVDWKQPARNDLLDLVLWIARDNLSAATHMRQAVDAAVRTLATHPRLGRRARLTGTRELVVPRTPYVVVYSLGSDTVEVLRVLHGARRWPPAR